MHTALMISGISGEAQMPRPNRLEVTPLHAQANPSQTKAQLAAPGLTAGIGARIVCDGGFARSLGITHSPRRHLSKHVYQEVPRSSPLSRKAVFHRLAVKVAPVQGPDRVSVR